MPHACRNCETKLEGRFCHRCGQRDSDDEVSFWRLAGDAIREAFEFDGRILRTARAFLTRPGFLVGEYLAGRRVHYTSPLRLYIFAALACFFILKVWGPQLEFSMSTTPEIAEGEPSGIFERIERHIDEKLVRLAALEEEDRRERISDAVLDATPTVLTVLLPLFALFLKFLYWRRRYIEHVVYALNIHAVALIALALVAPWRSPLLAIAGFLAVQVHVVVALRRVYGESWKRTALKYTALIVGYLAFLIGTMIATVFLALLQV